MTRNQRRKKVVVGLVLVAAIGSQIWIVSRASLLALPNILVTDDSDATSTITRGPQQHNNENTVVIIKKGNNSKNGMVNHKEELLVAESDQRAVHVHDGVIIRSSEKVNQTSFDSKLRHNNNNNIDKFNKNSAPTPEFGLVLMRAIGNSLPPRHSPNQTIVNLQFLLEHEPPFFGDDDSKIVLTKHWFVNRLMHKDVENEVIRLLQKHDQNYTVLPWVAREYLDIPYRFDRMGVVGLGISPISIRDSRVHHEKLVYASNVNGVRNSMLEMAASPSYFLRQQFNHVYMLPWDGNCMLTQQSYQALVEGITHYHGKVNYFLVPLDRLTVPNDSPIGILSPDYKPKPVEEPQVVLHHAAQGRFHPYLRYGNANKLDFLFRLTGHWKQPLPSFAKPYNPLSSSNVVNYGNITDQLRGEGDRDMDEKNAKHRGIPTIAWTTRLYSGTPQAEGGDKVLLRGALRDKAIVRLLEFLDARAIREHQTAKTSVASRNGTHTENYTSAIVMASTPTSLNNDKHNSILVGQSDTALRERAQRLNMNSNSATTLVDVMNQATVLVASSFLPTIDDQNDDGESQKKKSLMRLEQALELIRTHFMSGDIVVPPKWMPEILPHIPAFANALGVLRNEMYNTASDDKNANRTVFAKITDVDTVWQSLETWWETYHKSMMNGGGGKTALSFARNTGHMGLWYDMNMAVVALQTQRHEPLATASLYRAIFRFERIVNAAAKNPPQCNTSLETDLSAYTSYLTLGRIVDYVLGWDVYRQTIYSGNGDSEEQAKLIHHRVCTLFHTLMKCGGKAMDKPSRDAWDALQFETKLHCD